MSVTPLAFCFYPPCTPGGGIPCRYILGFWSRRISGETLDELNRNLKEVVELLLEDGE